MIETHVLKAKILSGKIIAYTGYVIVKDDQDNYLYSKFSDHTQLTEEAALMDAEKIKEGLK
jgi:hypothetical protein